MTDRVLRRIPLLLVIGWLMTMTAGARVLVHGHRGARALRPENTLPAFSYALQVGVDVLELDMAVTRDDVIVVSHDPLLKSEICTGPKLPVAIRDLTFSELQQYDCGAVKNQKFPKQQPVPGTRVPSLDEVFALAANTKVEFNIETKIFKDHPEYTPSPEKFVELVLAVVRKYGLEKRVILQSFDFRTLQVARQMAPDIRRSALYMGLPKDFVAIAHDAGATIISPYYRLVSKKKVDACHKAGIEVVPWTPNKPEEWRKLLDAGVDAIITDDPAELIQYLQTHPAPAHAASRQKLKLFGRRG